jgi:carbon-monoxide dehydrogenase medium subunit
MTTSMKEDAVIVLSLRQDDAEAHLSLGARVSLQAVYEAPASPELLRRALSATVTWQERNETTVEKALLSPVLAPQWVAALLALGSHATFKDKEGEKPLVDFLDRTGSHRDKLATVRLPLNIAGRVWGESHVARTPADEPIVAAIAVVDLTDSVVRRASLALIGVWHEPVRLAQSTELLVGGALRDDHIQQVAAAVEREVKPRGDFCGSVEYRRAMAAILTRRALKDCQREANRS